MRIPSRASFVPNPEAGGRWDPLPKFPPVEPCSWTFAKWKVAYFAGDIDRMVKRCEQHQKDAHEDAAILQRRSMSMTPPAPPPAGVSMLELLQLHREHPEAAAKVKAIIAQQDMAEVRKMAAVQRVMRDALNAAP